MARNESDLYSPAQDYVAPQVEIGTVGWEGRESHFEKGTADNDGHTLVCVTLYRGRDPGVRPKDGVAQGQQILCHISDGIYRIPPKGARVYVAIPHGMEELPGSGCIVASVSRSPTTQFESDRVVMDFGETTHVVIKGLSVSISDYANPARFIGVGTPRSGGTPGVQILLPDGTGAVWQAGAVGIFSSNKTIMQLTDSKWETWQSDIGFIRLADGECHSYAPVNKVQGGGVYLGKAPTVANTALWGATGIAGVASLSVFVSPV